MTSIFEFAGACVLCSGCAPLATLNRCEKSAHMLATQYLVKMRPEKFAIDWLNSFDMVGETIYSLEQIEAIAINLLRC